MRLSLQITLFAVFSAGLLSPVSAENVSREAPPEVTEHLLPLLLSTDAFLQSPPATPADAEDGVTLIEEDAQYVLEDGRRFLVQHTLEKAITSAGAEDLQRQTFAYAKKTQRIHLLAARTIEPDGTKLDVRPDAMFLQTPQRAADDSLYDDNGELVVVYSRVKPGSITEALVAIEEEKPRIPGDLVTGFRFASGWPVSSRRCFLDVPDAFGERIHFSQVGKNVPEPDKKTAGGRTIWSWLRQDCAAIKPEADAAPLPQVGPYLWVSSLRDWDEFVNWYHGRVEKSSAVGPKLAQAVEDLTRKAADQHSVINALTEAVAEDVRYVGLEFGSCDIEPHDVDQTWDQQYGDCKDKATLLRAMLAQKGIAASLALVNTEHLGLIERRSPDYRQFNHAIVAIPDGPEHWIFCDPTVAGSTGGQVSPVDGDRDVLLVGPKATWVHVPAQPAGRTKISYDAKVTADGEISGWMTLEAEGYYATWYKHRDQTASKEELRYQLAETLRQSWKNVRVIDVRAGDRHDLSVPYHIEAYFLVPASDAETLAFPVTGATLPFLEDDQPRRTDFPLWIETREVSARFELPAGLAPASLPPATDLKSPFADEHAQWVMRDGRLVAEFAFSTKRSRVAASECKAFSNALNALRQWLSKPLVLAAAGNTQPSPPVQEPDGLGDFPQMPTGDGQLALVEEKYPLDGNHALRRAALEKAIHLFPGDAALHFKAGVGIAYLDVLEEHPKEALQRVGNLLRDGRGSVSTEEVGRCEYVQGLALSDVDRAAALELFDRLSRQESLSANRRAWALYERASLLQESDATVACAAARGGIQLAAGNEPDLLALLARILAKAGRMAEFEADLSALLDRRSEALPESLAALARLAPDLGSDQAPQAAALLGLLRETADRAGVGKDVDGAIAEAGRQLAGAACRAEARAQVRKILSTLDKEAAAVPIPADWKSRKNFLEAIDEAENTAKDPLRCLRYGLEFLARFEPGDDFSRWLWKSASFSDWLDRTRHLETNSAELQALLGLCELMPKDDEASIEGCFLRASIASRRGDLAAAQPILLELSARAGLSDGYRATACERLGENAAARHAYEEARDAWRQSASFPNFSSSAVYLLKAFFIDLERDRRAEALQTLDLLRKMKPSVLAESEAHSQVSEFLALAAHPGAAEAYWNSTARWWEKWMAIDHRLAEPAPEGELLLPTIPDVRALGEGLGAAGAQGNLMERSRLLRVLAHASRWQPSMAIELAGLSPYLGKLRLSDFNADYLRLIAAIYENSTFEDAALHRQAAFWAAAADIDLERSGDALAAARAFMALPRQEDAWEFGMTRLWCMAADAAGQETAEAAAAAETALKSAHYTIARAQGVLLLCELYERAQRNDASLALLERETQNAVIKDDPQGLSSLQERLEALRGGSLAARFGQAAKAWLEENRPAWFDYLHPQSLEDPEAADLDRALDDRRTTLKAPELFKLASLVAGDAAQPESRRGEALAIMAWQASEMAPDTATAAKWAESFTRLAMLPNKTRAILLYPFLFRSFLLEKPALFARLAADPACAALDPDAAAAVEEIKRYFSLWSAPPAKQVEFAEELLGQPLTAIHQDLLRHLVLRIAERGAAGPARELQKKLASLPAKLDPHGAKAELELSLLKQMRTVETWSPVHLALRELALQTFGPPAAANAAFTNEPFDLEGRGRFSSSAATAFRLRALADEDIGAEGFRFWSHLLRQAPAEQRTVEIRGAFVKRALEKAGSDRALTGIVTTLPMVFDSDSAAEREVVARLLQPVRAGQDQPQTSLALSLYDLDVAERTGSASGSLAGASAITQEPWKSAALRGSLASALANGDREQVREIVNAIPARDLLGPRFIGLALRAYELLGMTDELGLAREKAAQLVYGLVTSAWTEGDEHDALAAFDLAETLHNPALIPENFGESLIASDEDQLTKWNIAAHYAVLRANWKQAVETSTQALREFPTYYGFHWLKGLALAKLGQDQQAAEDLEIYVRIVHDEPDAVQAKALLSELHQKSGSKGEPAAATGSQR